MAGRGEELNTRITATDDASSVVDRVADKVGNLEDTKHDIPVTADTEQAEREISSLDKVLDQLSSEDKAIVLRARADAAKREIATLERQLANAEKYDNTEIEMRISARNEAKADLDRIETQIRQIDGATPVIKPEVDGSALDGLEERVGKMAGAAGIAAILGDAINRGMDAKQGVDRLTGQFRITAEEAGRYGKLAADLYADNWGDSLREVQQSVALTSKRLSISTNAELRDVAAGVYAVSDTWGTEFERVVRSISQLMQNGLAGSATEALDLITAGFQAGGDEAGDFLETIDEYSQHWAAMGLSGEQALSQIVAGLQAGQRDTDKMADAVKEFRLRAVDTADAVSEAYRDLGLDADDYRTRILAGGESAREAFRQVITAIKNVGDPITQHKVAVALLGSQYEDLGPTALTALLTVEGKLGDVTTATEDLSASIKATPWEELERRGQSALGRVGNFIAGGLIPIIDGLDKLNNPGGDFAFDENGQLVRKIDDVADAASDADTAIAGATNAKKGFGAAARDATTAADGLADSLGGIDSAARTAATSLGLTESELSALINSSRIVGQALSGNLVDVGPVLEEIGDEAEDTAGDIDKVTTAVGRLVEKATGESDLLGLADQFQSVRESAEKAWEATANKDDDAAGRRRDHRQEILGLIGDVGAYLDTLDRVPTSKKTAIIADLDAGRLNEALAKLADLQKPGYKSIFVDLIDRTVAGSITFGPNGATAPTFSAPVPQPAMSPTYNTNNTTIMPPQSPSSIASAQRLNAVRNGLRPV